MSFFTFFAGPWLENNCKLLDLFLKDSVSFEYFASGLGIVQMSLLDGPVWVSPAFFGVILNLSCNLS